MDHSPESLSRRLERDRNAWLCTLRDDGSPHVTPVWFLYRPDTFWISSGEYSVKIRNLANDPRVSLALEDGNWPAVAEGRATVHGGTLRSDVLAALGDKYDGWDAGAVFEPFGPRVLLEIPIDRWLLSGVAQ